MFLSNSDFNFTDKTALVRIDCDVDLPQSEFRLQAMLPTIHFLQRKGVKKIILMGHKGRPDGQEKKDLSLQPIAEWFTENYKPCNLISLNNLTIEQLSNFCILENLRFHKGEKDNSQEFAKQLALLADVYVNDAFATAHRKHASLVGLPQFLPSFLGLRMEEELKTLKAIKNKPQRPLVFVLGGSKPGKLDYLEFLADWSDKLLIGGKHPKEFPNFNFQFSKDKVKIAGLKTNGLDIDQESIEEFKQEISQAKTIVWAGPMGVYEQEENSRGTVEITKAVAKANAFKLVGGGDTHTVLDQLNLWNSFDFISTGGGAMLQYLKEDSLPAVEAISKN